MTESESKLRVEHFSQESWVKKNYSELNAVYYDLVKTAF